MTSGIGHRIVIEGKEEAVLFSEQSDPLARWSLCHLRPEIVDLGDNEITLTGTLEERIPEPKVQQPHRPFQSAYYLFKITGWKMKTPYRIVLQDAEDISNPPKVELRTELRRDDFTSSADFDPHLPGFSPAAYLEK